MPFMLLIIIEYQTLIDVNFITFVVITSTAKIRFLEKFLVIGMGLGIAEAAATIIDSG